MCAPECEKATSAAWIGDKERERERERERGRERGREREREWFRMASSSFVCASSPPMLANLGCPTCSTPATDRGTLNKTASKPKKMLTPRYIHQGLRKQ